MSIKIGDLVKIKYNGAIMQLRLIEEIGGDIVTPESPVGQALIGKKKGDVFTIRTPEGLAKIEVLGYDGEYWDNEKWLIDD